MGHIVLLQVGKWPKMILIENINKRLKSLGLIKYWRKCIYITLNNCDITFYCCCINPEVLLALTTYMFSDRKQTECNEARCTICRCKWKYGCNRV